MWLSITYLFPGRQANLPPFPFSQKVNCIKIPVFFAMKSTSSIRLAPKVMKMTLWKLFQIILLPLWKLCVAFNNMFVSREKSKTCLLSPFSQKENCLKISVFFVMKSIPCIRLASKVITIPQCSCAHGYMDGSNPSSLIVKQQNKTKEQNKLKQKNQRTKQNQTKKTGRAELDLVVT